MNETPCLPDCRCDCCTGVARRTPLSIANPPGLDALSYRVGVYGDFLSSMLARLATMKVPKPDPAAASSSLARILTGRTTPTDPPLCTPLAALTTRSPDDPAIALLDAWAVVLDVLTFYQERIASEGFLRTATEQFSVRELARLVGYTPRPGVASSVFLAYTLEQGGPVKIPAGSRVSSTPGPDDKQPQSFETYDDLDADPRWNAPAPRRMRPQVFQPGQTTAGKRLFFQGLTTQLQPNDPLILVFDAAQGEAFRAKKVTPDNPNQRTTVVLQDFAATPVMVSDDEAANTAADAVHAAIDAYHEAEPVQTGAEIDIASAVRDGLNGLVSLPDTATAADIAAALRAARKAVSDQTARAVQLQGDNIPLDQVIGALDQMDKDLQALTGVTSPAPARDDAKAALKRFTDALGLGDHYQEAWNAVKQVVDQLYADVDALKNPASVVGMIFKLRSDLIQLRGIANGLLDTPFSLLATRLGGLIARLETVEDRLSLQSVSTKMKGYPPAGSPAGLADLAKALDLPDRWSEDQIKDLSSVNLANRIFEALRALRNLPTLPNQPPDLVTRFHDDAAGLLYAAIAGILRQILNRFFYEQQAGVPDDTQLRHSVEQDFQDLRNILNPLEGLDKQVHALVEQIRQAVQDLGTPAAQVPAVSPAPEPLAGLRDALQSAFDTFQQKKDLDLLIARVSGAVQDFQRGQVAYNQILKDVEDALRAYEQATAVTPGTAVGVLGAATGGALGATVAVGAGGPAALQALQTAVQAIRPRAANLQWLNAQLVDLLSRIGVQDPDTHVRDFIRDFRLAAEAIRATFTAITNQAVSLVGFLPSVSSVGNLLAKAQVLLLDLRRAQYVARAGQYPRVGPWLDEVVEALEQFSSDLLQKARPSPGDAQAGLDREQSTVVAGRLAPDNLPDLQNIGKPGSVPPASRFQLPRQLGLTEADVTDDPAAAFLDDLAPQLASAFNPSLGDKLYPALANTVTRRTRRFQGVYALRARSAPFGHNAPPHGVLFPDGTVAATQEWLLAFERATVRVTPVPSQGDLSGTTVEVQFDTPDGSKTALWSRATGTTGATRDITITPVGNGEMDITLPGPKLTKLKLVLQVTTGSGRSVTVTQTVGGHPEPDLQCNDLQKAVRLRDDGGYLAVSLNLQNNMLLSVVSEVRAATAPAGNRNLLRLDATNDKVARGGYVVVQRAGQPQPLVARIEAVDTVSPTDFNLSGTVTQLTLDQPWLHDEDTSLASLRDITVYVQSEALPLTGEPYDADLGGGQLEMDEVIPGLKPGRWLIVSGERTDLLGITGVQAAELVMLAAATQVVDAAGGDGQGDPHTLLRLAVPLEYTYQRGTATVWANVVKATQGETRSEILGAGNPAEPDQTFTLKQGPLTFLPAPVPSGVASTLQVRVNGILWHETDNPLGAGPTDRVYVLSQKEGAASVVFGDGTYGARPPAGVDNIRALYRVGLGRGGNVAAGSINQLATRPLGVKAVVNPLAASGGADPEGADSARRNAPIGVTAMGRLVSVADYVDFARGFAGIEKANATRISDGFVLRLHLTLAGQQGDAIDPASELYRNLKAALRRFGDPGLPFTLANRRLRFIVFAAALRIDPDYLFDDVAPAVYELLWDAYGYDRRDFAQDVVLSEIVALIQAVPGVAAVRVDGFGLVDQGRSTVDDEDPLPPTPLDELAQQIKDIATTGSVPAVLPVSGTRRGATGIRAAEIAVLSRRVPQTLILNEWKP